MRVLDLTSLENSEIKYKKQNFPDGQKNLLINNRPDKDGITLPGYYYMAGRSSVYALEPVTIKARLNNFEDLGIICCAVASLRNLGVKEIHLYVPYFLGARSDRKFDKDDEGFEGNNYLKDVICPIVNSLNLASITVLDPHSHVLEACLNNFKKINKSHSLLCNLLEEKYQSNYGGVAPTNAINKKCILVAPDAGAEHKIFKLAQQIGYTGEIIICSKERDAEGNIIRTIVPINGGHVQNDMIIVDDIIDGGKTFVEIAKVIKEYVKSMQQHEENSQLTYGKIYLILTHGIFSKGFAELSKYFDGIYCTNSYSDISFDGYASPLQNFYTDKVKQLNVF